MRLYLDTEAAAERLGLSPKTLRAQAAKGVLTGYKITPKRMVFAEDELIAYEQQHKGRFGVRSPNHPLHIAGNEPLDVAREWADGYIAGDIAAFDQEAYETLCFQIAPFMMSPVRAAPPEDFPRLFQVAVVVQREGIAPSMTSEDARFVNTGVLAAAKQFIVWQESQSSEPSNEA